MIFGRSERPPGAARGAALAGALLLALLFAGCRGGGAPAAARDDGREEAEAAERAIREARDLVVDTEVARRAAAYLAVRPNGALVVGILDGGRPRVLGFGVAAPGSEAPPGGTSLFEIGSITKVFTGILLARLAEEGVVSLDDPIARFLPAARFAPGDARGEITLAHLATHTSGLPRLPKNLASASPAGSLDPYAAYTRELLDADLAAVALASAPGERVVYSNYGAGLLGDLLSRAASRPYGELLAERVTIPLGLRDTVLLLDVEQSPRFVPGHAPGGAPAPSWHFDALAGAGGLRSTADDLLRFIAANLDALGGAGTGEDTLGRALANALRVHTRPGIGPIGLGWHRLDLGGRGVWWHNGGTGGYASFLALDPAAGAGVVVLSNHGDAMLGRFDVDELGIGVLARLGEAKSAAPAAPATAPAPR